MPPLGGKEQRYMTVITRNPEQARADDDGMAAMGSPPAIRDVPVHEEDSLSAIRSIVQTLSPASLRALMSLANGKLHDSDPNKIRLSEVKSLRRLASQAHALDASLLGHMQERRMRGEARQSISPEAANTALWTDRLIRALEGIVRRYE
jgi:hypothetical protein